METHALQADLLPLEDATALPARPGTVPGPATGGLALSGVLHETSDSEADGLTWLATRTSRSGAAGAERRGALSPPAGEALSPCPVCRAPRSLGPPWLQLLTQCFSEGP